MNDANRRPSSASGMLERSSSRRSVAASYLDLRPLPEDVLLEATNSSFDSVGGGDRSVKSWKEEEEVIRKRLHERLPSTRSLGDQRHTSRPSTAPAMSSFGIKNTTRKDLLAASASARSARYLAIQWRSRATQLNLSKSMPDVSKETAPSPVRISDGSESDSESESSESSESSSDSDVSCGTMDESIKSQVSDAQKVVEKWQQRWIERTESMSLCSENASREDDEDKDRTSSSAETLKMRGSGSNPREEPLPSSFGFAMRPPNLLPGRKLLTDESDQVEIISALKPYPLQPVNSGKEFFSDSQKRLKSFIDSDNDSDDDGIPVVERKGVFIVAQGGQVMETVTEAPSNTIASVGTNDDNLSHSSSGSKDDDIDQLSECSTTVQSLLNQVNDESCSPDLSFETNDTNSKEQRKATVIQTFCDTTEPYRRRQDEKTSYTQSTLDEQKTVSVTSDTKSNRGSFEEGNSVTDDSTVTTKGSSVAKVTKPSKTLKKQQKASTNKPSTQYSGSVQERIEAVKRKKAAAKKESAKKSSNNKTTRSRTGATSKKRSETSKKKQPITWNEHEIVFTFGLLTSFDDAPPGGNYPVEDEDSLPIKDKLETKSKLLHEIMSNFGDIIRRTKSLGNGSTRYMMCSPDCTPRPVRVMRDAKYKAPANRPKIMRSIVMATVPIFIPKDNAQAQEIATHVVLDLFSVAISKGDFSGLRFEKVS